MPELTVSTAQPGTGGHGKADLPGFQPGLQMSRGRAVLSCPGGGRVRISLSCVLLGSATC